MPPLAAVDDGAARPCRSRPTAEPPRPPPAVCGRAALWTRSDGALAVRWERNRDNMSPRKYLKQLGLLAGLALGSAVLAPSVAAADDPACEAQLIVVQGDGEVRVRPDSLQVDVGVESRAATLAQARNQVNVGMQRVIEAVRALGIPGLKLETRVLSVSPVYATRRSDEPPAIVGYAASNRVAVTIQGAPVDELAERGSRIIDVALAAGANTVGGLEFFLADPTPVEDAALADAVADAQRQATTIARAAGVTLGPIHSVEEAPGMRIVPRAARVEGLSATPIEVDEIVVMNNVTARFTFR